jgi:hypothetical protein
MIYVFKLYSSSAMYKPAQKLPVWQQTTAPTYRRSSLSRRFRVFIIIAICLLLWYRYSGPAISDNSRESIIDSSIALSYPAHRERLVQHEVVERQETEIDQKGELGTSRLLGDSHDEEDDLDSSPGVILIEKEQEQLDEEGISVNQAIREFAKKPPVEGNSEPSKLIENHAPPPLVKQASQKLIDQHLSPAVKDEPQKMPKVASPEAFGAGRKFPSYPDYAALDEKSEALPDIIHIPFEDTTIDVILEGWEDQWFADAELNVEKWGNLSETKIDFVYTCMTPLLAP